MHCAILHNTVLHASSALHPTVLHSTTTLHNTAHLSIFMKKGENYFFLPFLFSNIIQSEWKYPHMKGYCCLINKLFLPHATQSEENIGRNIFSFFFNIIILFSSRLVVGFTTKNISIVHIFFYCLWKKSWQFLLLAVMLWHSRHKRWKIIFPNFPKE